MAEKPKMEEIKEYIGSNGCSDTERMIEAHFLGLRSAPSLSLEDSPKTCVCPLPLTIPEAFSNEKILINRTDTVNWGLFDVLVGSVRNEAQYRHCLAENYYYVPTKYLTDRQDPIRYVAMYHALRFGDPGIRYYGKVIRRECVPRRQVPFPAARANGEEPYEVFTVKSWEELPQKIKPCGQSVYEPRFTNLFLLLNVPRTYALFMIRSAEQYEILKELRRAAANPGQLDGIRPVGARLWARTAGGFFELTDRTGRPLCRVSLAEFRRAPARVLRRIFSTLSE